MTSSNQLNLENFKQGFLVDEELMGGVSEEKEAPGTFLAYVMRHTTGEYLGAKSFSSIEEALLAINSVNREWRFEKTSGCNGCVKDENGNCTKGGGCSKKEGEGKAGGGCCSDQGAEGGCCGKNDPHHDH